jgi:hypothetical protein
MLAYGLYVGKLGLGAIKSERASEFDEAHGDAPCGRGAMGEKQA